MAAYLIIYGPIVSARGRLMHIREGEIRPAACPDWDLGADPKNSNVWVVLWLPPPHINMCAVICWSKLLNNRPRGALKLHPLPTKAQIVLLFWFSWTWTGGRVEQYIQKQSKPLTSPLDHCIIKAP